MPSITDLQRSWLLRQLGLTSSNLSNTDLENLLYASNGGPASMRVFQAGRYYPAGSDQAPSTNTLTLSQLYVVPFEAGEAFTATRIACEVTTIGTAGNVLRLGIYDSNDGIPNNRLVDAGTVAGDVLGGKEVVINLPLGPGLYWVAIASQVAASGQVRADLAYHNKFVANDALPAAATYASYMQNAAVAGALPAVFGAFVAQALAPKLFLKAA